MKWNEKKTLSLGFDTEIIHIAKSKKYTFNIKYITNKTSKYFEKWELSIIKPDRFRDNNLKNIIFDDIEKAKTMAEEYLNSLNK